VRDGIDPKSVEVRIGDPVLVNLGVWAALERSGLDHGPIGVFEKMKSMCLEPVPAVASLARIFRQNGVARLNDMR
jgi:hypothetical protein